MLTIENLVKTFPGDKVKRSRRNGAPVDTRIRAVDGISLEVREGELFTLLGPSGCGKTTTLRSIAGLERPDSGEIRVGDQVLFSRAGSERAVHVPVNRRGLGMVFQSYAIWPHMKVFENVAFPLQVMSRDRRPSKAEVKERVMRVLETLELGQLAGRPATKLSGGQQQRLALARALVIEPPLMLLDEPLSNLDAKLRESLRFELKRLQRDLGITSVYVTHDQIEAMALSSRIAVINHGKLVQVGRPREIYQKPANKFVAQFIGTSNFIDGRASGREGSLLVVETDQGTLRVSSDADIPAGRAVIVAVRPESILIRAGDATGAEPNEWEGTVVTRSFLGDSVDHLIEVRGLDLRARENPLVSIPPNTKVVLTMDPAQLTLIPTDE